MSSENVTGKLNGEDPSSAENPVIAKHDLTEYSSSLLRAYVTFHFSLLKLLLLKL